LEPNQLALFLTNQKLSNHEFAWLLGVTVGAVQHWLQGTRKIPETVKILIRYYTITGKSITELREFER